MVRSEAQSKDNFAPARRSVAKQHSAMGLEKSLGLPLPVAFNPVLLAGSIQLPGANPKELT
jgi:hypothetical protein